MSPDESHEQNNACAALLRWMVAEPEMARVITGFLYGLYKTNKDAETYHYEDQPATIDKYW